MEIEIVRKKMLIKISVQIESENISNISVKLLYSPKVGLKMTKLYVVLYQWLVANE